jgi:RimJ/RimL family protein N-acetyltransferase
MLRPDSSISSVEPHSSTSDGDVKSAMVGDIFINLVGAIGINRVSDDGLASEIGYGILPDYWGNGYAPEAVKMLAKYFFEGNSKYKITHGKIFKEADTS